MKTKEILKLIKDAKAEVLALEIGNPKGLLDAELIVKVQQVKYKLGHTLTKEDMNNVQQVHKRENKNRSTNT